MAEEKKIRVLIVDDSAFMRTVIERMLKDDPRITVIGTASNGKDAIEKTVRLGPDVVTLDIDMPIMDGLHALKEIMKLRPVPVIMVSSMTKEGAKITLDALELGAVDFVEKPGSSLSIKILDIRERLIQKIHMAAESHPGVIKFQAPKIIPHSSTSQESSKVPINWVVVLGASAGGPPAILNVLTSLPKNLPAPLIIAQHMPHTFTSAFAHRLNTLCNLRVKEATDGEEIQPSIVYICQGDAQTSFKRQEDKHIVFSVSNEKTPKMKFAPSIDHLFFSAAQVFGKKIIGIILTGMGDDGVRGLKNIRLLGGLTIAQDKATSVVYGMPRAALEEGAVCRIVPLNEIAQEIELALR